VISVLLTLIVAAACSRPFALEPQRSEDDDPGASAPPVAEVTGQCDAPLRDLLAYVPVELEIRQLSERIVPGSVAAFEVEVTSEHGPAAVLVAKLGDQLAQASRIDEGNRWFVLAPVPLYEHSEELELLVEGALYTGRLFADLSDVSTERIRRGKNRTRPARFYRKLKRKHRPKGPEERRLAAAIDGSADSRLWRGSFTRPTKTGLTSRFGAWRRVGRRWDGPHMGADYDGYVGWKVRAIGDGRVVMLGNHRYAGRTIVVDHGGGLISEYLHLSRRHVRKGDFVHKGEVIGRMGRTGRVTGPHLHLQVKLNGVDVDPESLLALDLSDDERPERSELFVALPTERDTQGL
jgi:murein DD-endopeptidase MepM/ murein hydrolase activator NlpD